MEVGTVTPRVLAVLRFTTSWNWVGRSIGRSAGTDHHAALTIHVEQVGAVGQQSAGPAKSGKRVIAGRFRRSASSARVRGAEPNSGDESMSNAPACCPAAVANASSKSATLRTCSIASARSSDLAAYSIAVFCITQIRLKPIRSHRGSFGAAPDHNLLPLPGGVLKLSDGRRAMIRWA
jgi:hypothetical protein